MYRNNLELMSETRWNAVLNHGALGDAITSLPAIIFARQTHNEALTIKVWLPNHLLDLFRHLLAPYGKFEFGDMKEFPLKQKDREDWGQGPVSLNSAPFNTHTRNRVHMVDFAFNFLLDAAPSNMRERSYPTAAPLGHRLLKEKYVVFPVGATSDNKLFRAKVMTPILRWCIENGYQPVIVGTKKSYVKALGANGIPEPIIIRDEADKIPADVVEYCRDLREQTTLLELRDICGYASAVVGVDGGTIHLAATTMVPIIYGLTTTLPRHRYIARLGDHTLSIRYVVPRNLECAGCQSNYTLLFHMDFRFCPYGDNICVDQLHHDDFISGLKELGL